MQQASILPKRYGIGKTDFYKRRNYLVELGYNMEPVKEGRKRFYSDEQVQLFDELDAYIHTNSKMLGFTFSSNEVNNSDKSSLERQPDDNKNSEIVHQQSELMEIEPALDEELIVSTNPLDDITEQNLHSVDVAAQYAAAQNLVAFNYLQLDYMKHRNFSVAGLSEEVHKSEQAVRKSFANMMESPETSTKKLIQKLKAKRDQ